MVRAKFTYFFDVKTVQDKITRVNVRYGGGMAQSAFQDYFTRFKYFKPGSVKINIKPCATLPIDPSGLSYTAAEQNVDPRDMFSLGMCRITNGEQIPDVPENMSSETAHKFYDNMMLDHRWFKFSPHKGLVKSAVPKYWSISQIRQDHFPGAVQTMPGIIYGTGSESGVAKSIYGYDLLRYNAGQHVVNGADHWSTTYSNWQRNVQFQDNDLESQMEYDRPFVQNGLEPVRFMPTDQYVMVQNVPSDETSENGVNVMRLRNFRVWTLADCPSGEIMVLYFPPSYKTFTYFRIWVTESYIFKGYVNTIGVANGAGYDGLQCSMPVDRYIRPYNGVQQTHPWDFTSRVINRNLSRQGNQAWPTNDAAEDVEDSDLKE